MLFANPDVVPDRVPSPPSSRLPTTRARCGIAGPRTLWPDGTWQPTRRRFPTVGGRSCAGLRSAGSSRRSNGSATTTSSTRTSRARRGRLAARRLPAPAPRDARRARRLGRGLPALRRGHRPLLPRDAGGLGALVRPAAVSARWARSPTGASSRVTPFWHARGMARFVRKHPETLARAVRRPKADQYARKAAGWSTPSTRTRGLPRAPSRPRRDARRRARAGRRGARPRLRRRRPRRASSSARASLSRRRCRARDGGGRPPPSGRACHDRAGRPEPLRADRPVARRRSSARSTTPRIARPSSRRVAASPSGSSSSTSIRASTASRTCRRPPTRPGSADRAAAVLRPADAAAAGACVGLLRLPSAPGRWPGSRCACGSPTSSRASLALATATTPNETRAPSARRSPPARRDRPPPGRTSPISTSTRHGPSGVGSATVRTAQAGT